MIQRTKEDNKGFAEQQKADFPLLSDPSKATANAYGVLNPERGSANRWTFYLAKDGRAASIDKATQSGGEAIDDPSQ